MNKQNKSAKELEKAELSKESNSENISSWKEELTSMALAVAIAFLLFFIVYKIGFYDDNVITVAKAGFGFFWLFIIPGIAVTYAISDDFSRTERIIIGFGLGAACTGLLSYNLGVLGLNIKYHSFVAPVITIAIFSVLIYFKYTKKK